MGRSGRDGDGLGGRGSAARKKAGAGGEDWIEGAADSSHAGVDVEEAATVVAFETVAAGSACTARLPPGVLQGDNGVCASPAEAGTDTSAAG